jgi:hypothetical protein
MNKLALLALLPTALSAQVLLTDDFNDSAINPALWTVSTPYADSSVTESSGYLQVQNRGRLTANQNFTSPYSITGSIQLSNNEFSNAKIVIRSDNGSIGAAEMGGIAIQFSVREDGGSYQNQLGIFTNGAPIESSASSFIDATLDLDTWYSFEIRDTGSEVSLYWNGSVTPTVALSTSYSIGSTIGFYNREGAAAGSGISNDGIARLDSFVVTVIPEPASFAALAGFLILGVAVFRRNRT